MQIEIRYTDKSRLVDFDNTGFNLDLQVGRFCEIYSTNPELAAEQMLEDVKGFYYEYMAQKKALPIAAFIKDGKLYSPVYQSYFTELMDNRERNGAVFESICAIESALNQAPVGSIVFFTSPPGPANLFMRDGTEIIFPQTQTYFYQKVSEKDLVGTTVVTSMGLNNNARFLEAARLRGALDISNSSIAASAESYITSQALILLPFDMTSQSGILEVVELIRDFVSETEYQKIVWELKNREEVLALSQEIESELLKFNQFLVTEDFTPEELKKALREVILKINYYQNLSYKKEEVFVNLQQSLCNLALKAGCNGGGGVSRGILGARRYGTEKNLIVTCPFCHSRVNAIIANGKISCPSCLKSAAYRC